VPVGVFDNLREEAYPYRFNCTLEVAMLVGGTPSDPRVAEGWLRTKLGLDKDELIREAVAKTMAERGIGAEEATQAVNAEKNLNGFKRFRCPDCNPEGPFCADGSHELYIEGRQVKAMLKEAASIAVAADKLDARGWGKTNKGLLSYVAEHVFIIQKDIGIGVTTPDGINQRFVHTFRGTGIQYEEFVNNANVSFTVISDHDFKDRDWAMIWLAGEQNGLGASRSQGYGTFIATQWDRDEDLAKKARVAKKTATAEKTAAAPKKATAKVAAAEA
jgi:hypothetical protein